MTKISAYVSAFNVWLAEKITNGVSTMWCAYGFAGVSVTSLPSTLKEHSINADVQWVAQTFLQLVLLSVIMVGQKVISDKHDALQASHDAMAEKVAAVHDVVTADINPSVLGQVQGTPPAESGPSGVSPAVT